ncbi:isoleucyl-tRNA synthetase [Pedobacter africanus]|uniref:Isoleucyl-tRNA synthetase n=1 Tax=Pedobacter africanus TaxID=151894 RepID=A0A1W2AU74_9SPHI|nr:isoleucyl-tRNA synthetase [Pedobacter africanus]SMC63758.1 hypothetical protein SAMN04488524_1635 [Pedobacter africanus]
MIKVLRLQKAVYVILLGVIGLVAYKLIEPTNAAYSVYVLKLSGLLFLVGALWFLYPIMFAKKVNDVEVQLDPEKQPDPAETTITGQP